MNRQGVDGEAWDLNVTPKYREITVLLWNIKGAGSNDFVLHLKSLIHIHNPEIVILLETKGGEDRANQVMKQMGFTGYTIIPSPVGRKKGTFGFFGETMCN